MHTYLLPRVHQYLADHSGVGTTTTVGLVAVAALLVVLVLAEAVRITLQGDRGRQTEALRALAVPAVPLILVVGAIVVQRFRLLG